MKVSAYVPGSYYKRFNGTNMSRMNRESVSNISSAMNSIGTTAFTAMTTQSDGIAELVAKKYATRIKAEAQAKLDSAVSSLKGTSA